MKVIRRIKKGMFVQTRKKIGAVSEKKTQQKTSNLEVCHDFSEL